MTGDTLVFWGHPDPATLSAAQRWAESHPSAPIVATREGQAVAVRRNQNHCSRQQWERRIIDSPELRELVCCPNLAGQPSVRPAPARPHGPDPDRPRPIQEGTFWGRVRNFLSAVTGPRVSADVFQRRLRACTSNACGHLRTHEDKVYCGACGCPRWKLAELHTKLWFGQLECPAEPPAWGPEKEI